MSQPFEDFCEEKARAGDGTYAIAYALLRLTKEQERLATKVGQIAFDGPAHNMGALEYIGVKLGEIGEALDNLNITASVTGSMDIENA